MIRYAAKGKSTWKAIDDDPVILKQLEESGVYEFITVLSVSEVIDEETTNYDELKYKGPLYFDIDNKENIQGAIDSTQELIEKLQSHGILEQYIQIFCTGSKGFHVLVHPKVFSNARPMKNLPSIYKEIALKFAVEGLDFVVYSEKRGRMWRVPNFQRSNEKYKVYITQEELFDITPEKYQLLISSPRKVISFPEQVAQSSEMKLLFKECKRNRDKKVKAMLNSKGLGSEHFKNLKEIPACIEQVRTWDGLRNEAHFNQIILQTVTYMKASEMEDSKADILINDIAKSGTSSRFPTEQERRREIVSKLGYVNKSNYKFDCSYMRSVLEDSPCKGCELEHACKDGVEESEEGTLGIVVTDKGYYRGDQLISTFTLKPVSRFLHCDSGMVDKTVAVEVEVMVENIPQGRIRLTEDAFMTKGELLRQTKGFDKAVFLGVDTDIQKIKHNVFNLADLSQMGDIMETYVAGIIEARRGSGTLVYVEPDYSIDQYKTAGTHLLASDMSIPPNIAEVILPLVEEKEETLEVFRCLLEVNKPEVIAQVLGWVSACHLKTHLSSGKEGRREFPLMFLTGNAGTGKTQTAGLFLNLHCIDYLVQDSAPSLGSITEWALIEGCSSTATTPRLLDEFNLGKMGRNRYSKASEILKMAWGSQTINRGTITKGAGTMQGRTGARTITIPISSPLMVLGEQQPTEPAVQQRSCIVPLKVSGRKGREAPFMLCVKNTEIIRKVGKAMVFNALRKPLAYATSLKQKYEEFMPEDFEPRAKVSYQTILMGLDFFQDTMRSLKLDLDKEIDSLRETLLKTLTRDSKEISKAKAETEMDRAINMLAIMSLVATNSMHENNGQMMVAGVTYLKTDDFLYLDLAMCYTLFANECNRTGKICVIETPAIFKIMLMEEFYCVSTDKLCEEDLTFAAGRKVSKLDLKMMKSKGIEIELFGMGDTFTVDQSKTFSLPEEL